ncbi:MAG: hypothetical protein ABI367_02820 [Mucilaginibacter sp.]
MELFDFLFYYSTLWYSKATTNQFRNPPQQASYVLGISSSLYVYSLSILIEYFITKSFKSQVPIWVFMVIALVIIQLFQYIYINKGRYNDIKERYLKSNISDKKGKRLTVAFIVSGLVVCVLSIVFIHLINNA